MPLVNLVAAQMPFNQMLEYALEVPAATTDMNLWEAPTAVNPDPPPANVVLSAKTVIISCEVGGGGIVINPGTGSATFPLTASVEDGNGFLVYSNPSGAEVGASTAGIQKINVSTVVASRFKVYLFL